jgi:hypothetical protein
MDNALGNPFVIEVEDLFPEMEVVDNEGTARTNPKRVLVVGDWAALRRGQDVVSIFRVLVQFGAFASMRLLIVDRDGVRLYGLRWSLGHGHPLMKEGGRKEAVETTAFSAF